MWLFSALWAAFRTGNLSSFLIRPHGDRNAIACDAGSLVNGLNAAQDKGAFRDVKVPEGSTDSVVGHVLKNDIKGYLISHAHLDHLAGLVIASPDDSNKTIYSLPSVSAEIEQNYFNWKAWPNMLDRGQQPQLKKYHLEDLKPGEAKILAGTRMTVTPFPLNHGGAKSTAFLIESGVDAILCFSDTGPDEVQKASNMQDIWKVVADKVRQQKLKAIILEVSYTSDRPDNGVVTLTSIGRIETNSAAWTASSSNAGRRLPFRHGVEAVEMGGRGGAAGAGWNEKIADGREDTDEPLQVPGRSKALHHPLSSAERQMRIFRSIVKPLVRAVFDVWHDLTLGGRVGAELVGDHPPGWAALLPQQTLQQALGRLGVASALDDLIEHIAVLINRPPQPVLLARDRDHDLIEVPDVAAARRLAPETASVRRPELQRPAADGLVGDDDAALEQHLLDQPQAQRKPEVQPDRMGDDLRRKAVAFVADGLAHAGPSTRSQSNPS